MKLSVNTTQNVPLYFTPASIGDRMLGYFVDMVIKLSYLVAMFYVMKFSGISDMISDWDNWSKTAVQLFFYAPVAFYSLACESLMEGQTFGKKLVKTKVVKIDGFQASFTDYLTRWLFRLIDIDIAFMPGVLAMLLSSKTQRVGDIAAGTAVISLRAKYSISHTILAEVGDDYVPMFSQAQILRFSDNDMRIIKDNALDAFGNSDAAHIATLVAKIETVMQVKNTFDNSHDFVAKVLEDYNFYTGKETKYRLSK